MNLFQSIISNQYADLKKNNKDTSKAKFNAIILCAVILFLYTASIFIATVLILPDLIKIPHSWLGLGKTIGRIGALILIFVLFFIIKQFVITNDYYNTTIEKYELLDEQNKKSVYNKAFIYLFSAIGLFFLILMTSLIIK